MILVKFKKTLKENFLLKRYKCKKIIRFEDLNFDKNFFNFDGKKISELDILTYKIYKKTLSGMSKRINKYLNLNFDNKRYEYLIGYWLIHFIQQAYFKHIIILKILKKFPNNIFLISKNKNIYCNTSLEYFNQILNDEYQEYLFSEIVRFMNLNYHGYFDNKFINILNNKSKISVIKYYLSLLYILFFSPKYIYVDSYFKKNPIKKKIGLIIKSKFNLSFFNFYPIKKLFEPDIEFRNHNIINKNKKFEDYICDLAIKNIPIEFLEGNQSNGENIQRFKKFFKNKIFLSSQSLSFNTMFKFYKFYFPKENKLIYMQHGHGYGMDRSNISERYEVSLSDYFLSYGWKSKIKKVIPFYLENYYTLSSKTSNDLIILSSIAPRHLHRFQQFPVGYKITHNFIYNNLIFLKNIKFKNKIFFRNYPNSKKYGWNFGNDIMFKTKRILIDKEHFFFNSVSNKKLIIFDHFGTSFLEILQSDKPCIVYLDKNSYCFNKTLEKEINKLRDANIIFYDPISAADHLNKVINNINNWWFDRNTIKSKESFIDIFCKKSKNYDRSLIKILEQFS